MKIPMAYNQACDQLPTDVKLFFDQKHYSVMIFPRLMHVILIQVYLMDNKAVLIRGDANVTLDLAFYAVPSRYFPTLGF